MRKEQITDKEAICLLSIFIMGSTLLLGIGKESKNDAWLAGITAIVMSIPMVLIYARILTLFPGNDLFDILQITLGKVVGKAIAVLYIWYAFHLGALVLRNFGEFITTVTMPETPLMVPLFCLGLVCAANVKAGIEVMARVSAYVFPVLLAIIFAVQLLGIAQLHFTNIKPVLGNGFAPVLKDAYSAFTFPFAETVLFIATLFSVKTKKSPYKVYLWGVLLAGFIMVLLTLRNIMVLGKFSGKLYFPAHVAVSRISVGNFLQRIEVTVAIIFIFGVFIKSSVSLFVACRGIQKVFNLKDYRTVVIQVALLMVYLSYILYDSIIEMSSWAFKAYPYYAFPFQVAIPILLLIAAEIKVRRDRKQQCSP